VVVLVVKVFAAERLRDYWAESPYVIRFEANLL